MVKFARVLDRGDTIALAFGAMVGWSWAITSSYGLIQAGIVGTLAAFVVGGLMVFFIGLTYSELVAAIPKAGGEHAYSERALNHGWSFVCTWAIIFSYVAVVAFEAVSLGTVLKYLFPHQQTTELWSIGGSVAQMPWAIVGIVVSIIMTWINVRGIKIAALLQKMVTFLIFCIGCLLIVGAVLTGDSHNFYTPIEHPYNGTLSVLILVPFMLIGFDVIPQAAEEINMPYRSIGKLLLLSVALAVVWYIGVAFAIAYTLNFDQILNSSLAPADALNKVLGSKWGGILIVIAGVCGILTSWNAFLIGSTRAIYALANAGSLPACFGKLHPKYKTPYNAVLLVGVLVTIAPLFGHKVLLWLVKASGVGIVVAYAIVALSFLVLRKNEPEMPRPFKVYQGKVVGVIALLLSCGLFTLYLPFSPSGLDRVEWFIVGGWFLFGLLLYCYTKRQNKVRPKGRDLGNQ